MTKFYFDLFKFLTMVAAICFHVVMISVSVLSDSKVAVLLFAVLLFVSILIAIVYHADTVDAYYDALDDNEEE